MSMFCESACINKTGRINNILQQITIIITLYSTTNICRIEYTYDYSFAEKQVV